MYMYILYIVYMYMYMYYLQSVAACLHARAGCGGVRAQLATASQLDLTSCAIIIVLENCHHDRNVNQTIRNAGAELRATLVNVCLRVNNSAVPAIRI